VATPGRIEGEKVYFKDSNEYHPENILTEKKNNEFKINLC
jgi:hypothetical protein